MMNSNRRNEVEDEDSKLVERGTLFRASDTAQRRIVRVKRRPTRLINSSNSSSSMPIPNFYFPTTTSPTIASTNINSPSNNDSHNNCKAPVTKINDSVIDLTERNRQLEAKVQELEHQLLQATTAANENTTNTCCVVCLDKSRNIVLLPCTHCCLCHDCMKTGLIKQCPICKAHHTGYVVLLFP